MSDTLQLTYSVRVTGLDQAAAQAETAARSADLASGSVRGFAQQAALVTPMISSGVHAFNSARTAAREAHEALTTLNPEAALGALLALTSVAANLTRTVRLLQESTAAAAAGQAVLAALSGRLWLIPLALGAGALAAGQVRGMQSGGPVQETGVYLLHRGEYVQPAASVHSYGPIFVTFSRQPDEGADSDAFLRELGGRVAEAVRRS